MSSTLFDIEFTGELMPGSDGAQTRARLQRIFKLSDEAAAQLFSGAPVTVKHGLDAASAAKMHDAFARVGAVVRIVPAGAQDARAGAGATGDVPALDLSGPTPRPSHPFLHGLFHHFERSLAFVLLILIAAVALIALVELCFVLYKDLTSTDGFLLGLDELFEVFGMFLIVLIAVELMASIYMYMVDKSVHIEMMLLIAITALARKVVVLDLEGKGDPAMYMVGLAALLAVLVGGYYLVKRLD